MESAVFSDPRVEAEETRNIHYAGWLMALSKALLITRAETERERGARRHR